MEKVQSIRVSFVPRPTSTRWTSQVAPIYDQQQNPKDTNEWIPNEHESPLSILSGRSDNVDSSLNNHFKNSSVKLDNENNKTKCFTNLFISLGILLTLIVLTAMAINIYLLIYINKTTTTTTTTTTLSSQCYSYMAINDTTREVTFVSGINATCDWSLFSSTYTWTRFTDDNGKQIVQSPPASYLCNTHATGWYTGLMPAYGATVNGTVCYVFNSTSCFWSNTIQVTDCGSFYVYGLISPPTCSLRYCTN